MSRLTTCMTAPSIHTCVTGPAPSSVVVIVVSPVARLRPEPGHPLDEVLKADLAFVSPGIPPQNPVLEAARQRGIPLSSATELFFARCRAPIVGIIDQISCD